MYLSLLVFLPLAGALPLLLARDREARELKVWAFLVSLATLLAALPLWFDFSVDPGAPLYQFAFSHPWIYLTGLKIDYAMGVDGISALLMLLTAFISPIAILGSWTYIKNGMGAIVNALAGAARGRRTRTRGRRSCWTSRNVSSPACESTSRFVWC